MSRPKGLPKTTNHADDFDLSKPHGKSSADVDTVKPNNFFDNQNFNNPSKISGSDYKNADYLTTNGNKYQYDFEARPVGDYNINHNKNYITNTSQVDIDFQKPKSYQNRLVTEAIGYADDLPVPKTTSSMRNNFSFFEGIPIDDNTRILRKTTTGTKYLVQNDNFIRVRLFDETIVHNCSVIDDFKHTKKSRDLYIADRKIFNTQVKSEFIKKIAKENRNDLLRLGLSDIDIDDMLYGVIPDGFEVHHKIPLDDGGTNDFDNLILIDVRAHRVFTGYQNSITRGLKAGHTRVINWVLPKGQIYYSIK